MGVMEEGQRTGPVGRYGLLLAMLIAAYLVSAVTHSRLGGVLHVAFIGVVGLLALRNTRLTPRLTRLTAAGLVVTAIAAGFCAASGNPAAMGAEDIWSGLILLLTVLVIVDRVVRLDQVTAESIYAALSAYLLIGLMFSAFFAAIDVMVSTPFFADSQPANSQTLQYFSFTTLTTLGYGDFTAAGSFGRALAVLEAISGQVFLATLVARLVSAYGTVRRPPPPAE
jgi:Ion channel